MRVVAEFCGKNKGGMRKWMCVWVLSHKQWAGNASTVSDALSEVVVLAQCSFSDFSTQMFRGVHSPFLNNFEVPKVASRSRGTFFRWSQAHLSV
ncbi:hypothetical protein CDAR_471461 [Caerostris darwini]|uniref:Uncharacterized protein n=1 Tax=Caerostris darwini TaxID=1538125 RepID=A0AAV4RM09_9ARAC|nr:hypothetical protein CDAR_471461 [Caerostris darwini]